MRSFYSSLTARISTARGLTGPYRLLHGCAQGDSGGVGTYTALRAIRTAYHRGVLRQGLRATTLQSGAMTLSEAGLPLPGGGECLTELSFSDDTRLFARSRPGIIRVLEVAESACLATCSSLNPGKTRAYRVASCRAGIFAALRRGTWSVA